jgi:hypothetical protein
MLSNSCLDDREQCEDEWLRNVESDLNNLVLGFIREFKQFDTKSILLIERLYHDIHT